MPWTITDCLCAMRSVIVRRPEWPIRATIDLPRSKSVANRALVLAALAGDIGCVQQEGDADDTRILVRLLKERPRVMHCGLGGTTFRFLLAWACVQEGMEHVVTGDARLLERPHDALFDALRSLGADITRTAEGFLVRGRRMEGGAITIDSPVSSQFITALLLVAPTFRQGLQLTWKGRRLSEPYVDMTMRALAHFGVRPRVEAGAIHVRSAPLHAAPFTVPPDWSAAAFWFQIVALAPDAEVRLEGLHVDGWQGDERIMQLRGTGVAATRSAEGVQLKNIDPPDRVSAPSIDLGSTPDLFQPLALTLAALGTSATFTGLDNLPLKETDRLKAVADVLRSLGLEAIHADGRFSMTGRIAVHGPLTVDPQHDHRMAMATAPLALVLEAVTVLDPDVVGKSYPGFWEDLRKAGFAVVFRDR